MKNLTEWIAHSLNLGWSASYILEQIAEAEVAVGYNMTANLHDNTLQLFVILRDR